MPDSSHKVDAAARITINRNHYKTGKPFIGRTIAIDPQTNIAHYRTHPIRVVNHVPDHL